MRPLVGLLCLVFLQILHVLPIHAQQARLYLQQHPNTLLAIGDTLKVEVYADAQGLELTSASAYISFDEAVFALVPAWQGPDGAVQPFTNGPFLAGQVYENSTAGDGVSDNGLQGFQLNYVTVSGAGENRSTGRGAAVLAEFSLLVVGYPASGVSGLRLDAAGQRQPFYTTLDEPGVAHRFRVDPLLWVAIEGEGLLPLAKRSMVAGERQSIDLAAQYITQKWQPEDITWSAWSAAPAQLAVEIIGQQLVLQSVAAEGSVVVFYRVGLPDGQMIEASFAVMVAATERQLRSVARTLAEDSGIQHLDLAEFLRGELAEGQWHWSVQAPAAIIAEIAGEQLVFTVAADWYGSEILTVALCDELGRCETTTLAIQVDPVNDPPQIAVTAPIAVAVGGMRHGPVLAEIIADPDHEFAELEIVVGGDEMVAVAVVEGVLKLSGLAPGIGRVLLQVMDPLGGQSTAELAVQVVRLDAGPRLEVLPDMTLAVAERLEVLLTVTDRDTPLQQLEWSVAVAGPVAAAMVSGAAPLLALHGLAIGEAVVRLQVRDPEGSESTMALRVLVVEPMAAAVAAEPVPVPEQATAEDIPVVETEVANRDADPEVAAPTGSNQEEIPPATSNLLVEAEDSEVVPEPVAAADIRPPVEDDAIATPEATDAPIIDRFLLADIPDVQMIAGSIGEFWLDDYVVAGEAAALQWSVTGMVELLVKIDAARRVEVQAPVEFSGREVLLLRADDGAGNSAVVAVRISVEAAAEDRPLESAAAEDLPATAVDEEETPADEAEVPALELASWPEISLLAGRVDSTLVLDQLVTIGDPQKVVWSLRGGVFIQTHIDEQRRLHLDGAQAVQGREIFFLEAQLGSTRRQLQLVVGVRVPVFTLKPFAAIYIEDAEYILELGTYVSGDFAPGEIEWQVQAPDGIVAAVTAGALRINSIAAGLYDLAIKAIAPSGQVVEVSLVVEVPEVEQSAANESPATEPTPPSEEELAPIVVEQNAAAPVVIVDPVEIVAADTRAPGLHLSGHLMPGGVVEFRLDTDELLAGVPVLLADGRVLAVELRADYYVAHYEGGSGSIQVLAAASDLAGNTAETQLALSTGQGQGILSPDGRLRVQGRLGAVLLYGEEDGYRVELEAGSTAELVFIRSDPEQGLFRLGPIDWEEIPVQIGGDELFAVVAESGLYRLAKGSVATVDAVPTAYPNPFNAEVVLRYLVAAQGPVRVVVYDALGAQIGVLLNQVQGPGLRTILWDGRDQRGVMAASGVYLLVVEASGQRRSRKVMLIR